MTHFRPLEIFFPKIKVKSVKNEKWPKMVKKGQKWIYLVSQHCLQPFLLPEPVKSKKKSFFIFSWNFLDFWKKNDWFPSFHGHLVTVCQLLNAFPTLPDIYFVHKSHQLAELPSRERKFDQISPTEKPQNYVCQFSNGFVLYPPVSLWYPDIELNV